MRVEQKSYAQIVIVDRSDFIFGGIYDQYEAMCPFLCFPGMFAADFRGSTREPDLIQPDKDVILLLGPYWVLLATEEKKAILDHELGHISNGDLKKIEEKVRRTGRVTPSQVDQAEEMAADAYSSNLNGEAAIYEGLIKCLGIMVKGLKKRGYNLSVSEIINRDPIIRNRLNLLQEKIKEQGGTTE
jgi:hypothetical protein